MIHKDPCMKNDHLTVLFEEAGVEPVQPKLSQRQSSGWSWKKYERPGLMQDEIEEIKAAFDLFDVDGTQRIHPRDLRMCIQSLNLRRNQVVRHILNDLERFGAKPIDFKAFLDIMTAKMGERDTKEDVSKVFRLFDDDRTGSISLKNLQRVARELGEQLPVEALEEMIARADSDADGKVTEDDFYVLMTEKTFPY